jgi:hypothetical protein
MRLRLSRLWPLLFLLGCEPQQAVWRPLPAPTLAPAMVRRAPPAGVVALLDQLTSAEVSGRASDFVDASPRHDRVLLASTFDPDEPGRLAAVGEARPEFVRGGQGARGSYLRIRGPSGGSGVAWPAIPVRGGRRIRLAYWVRSKDIDAIGEALTGVATLWYADGSGDSPTRIPLGIKLSRGSSRWRRVRTETTLPEDAVSLIVALDFARANGESPILVSGSVEFDDLRVSEITNPFAVHRGPSEGPIPPHPLLGRVRIADETRDAVFVPTPSIIEMPVELPPGAQLQIGMGVLPATGANDAAIHFRVEVEDQEGTRSVGQVDVSGASRTWVDRKFLLSESGGTTLLRLVTESPVDDLPAIFSDPWIIGAGEPGHTALLVGIDTLAAHRTSIGTAPGRQTPHLAALALHGTSYSRAYSAAPWTLPAFASIFTGEGPGAHGAGAPTPEARGNRAALPAAAITMAERLRAAGWQTRAWINNPFLTDGFGLDQGFSRYRDVGTRNAPGAGSGAVEALLAWLAEPSSADRFAFLHLMEPHGPYRPAREETAKLPPAMATGVLADGMQHKDLSAIAQGRVELGDEERAYAEALHDATIRDVDRLLAPLRKFVQRQPRDSLWLAVTSDHGEELWEHGGFEHGHSVFDEVVHVPLLIVPGPAPGGGIDTPVSTLGIAAELLSFAGLEGGTGGLLNAAVVGGRTLYGPDRWYHTSRDHRLVLHPERRAGSARSRPADGPGEWLALTDDPEPTEAAQVFEAFDRVAAEWLRSLEGRWVIALLPGRGESPHLAGWVRNLDSVPTAPARLAWPDSEGRLQDVAWYAEGSFVIPGGGGILALPVLAEADFVDVDLGGASEETVRLTRDAVVDPARFFSLPAGPKARVLVGFVPPRMPARPSSPRDDTLSELRALGYLE